MSKRTREAAGAAAAGRLHHHGGGGAGVAARADKRARRDFGGCPPGLEATIQRVLEASDWRELFGLPAGGVAAAEGDGSSSRAEEVAARAVRNRLARVVHPDHVPDEQQARATQAAQRLNELWSQARQHFHEEGEGRFTSGLSGADTAGGGGGTYLAASVPAVPLLMLTGGPAVAAGGDIGLASVVPGGSLELLAREVAAGRMLERWAAARSLPPASPSSKPLPPPPASFSAATLTAMYLCETCPCCE
jgi:hypothetical protein